MKKLVWFIVVVIVLYGAWYFGSPLIFDEEVHEALPEELASESSGTVELPQFEMPTEEEFSAMSEEEQMEKEKEMVAAFATEPDKVMEDPMPMEMAVDSKRPPKNTEKMGQFRDADSFHKGSGIATTHTLNDGSKLLRLEHFSVTNGPDLHVLLVQHDDPMKRSDVRDSEYIDLGQLKGNKGSQNYDIPEGTDLSDYGSVVIYCKPFHVIFSVAPLEEVN